MPVSVNEMVLTSYYRDCSNKPFVSGDSAENKSIELVTYTVVVHFRGSLKLASNISICKLSVHNIHNLSFSKLFHIYSYSYLFYFLETHFYPKQQSHVQEIGQSKYNHRMRFVPEDQKEKNEKKTVSIGTQSPPF